MHAYGKPRLIEGEEAMMAAQKSLVETYEGAEGWKLASQPEKFIKGMLSGIICFEIPITRLEGKFKMSQNRPASDLPGIVEGLRNRAEGDDLEIAEMLDD